MFYEILDEFYAVLGILVENLEFYRRIVSYEVAFCIGLQLPPANSLTCLFVKFGGSGFWLESAGAANARSSLNLDRPAVTPGKFNYQDICEVGGEIL